MKALKLVNVDNRIIREIDSDILPSKGSKFTLSFYRIDKDEIEYEYYRVLDVEIISHYSIYPDERKYFSKMEYIITVELIVDITK